LVALFRHFRLSKEPGGPGLTCGPEGLYLAGAPLLRKTADGLVPRRPDELAALTLAAFGEVADVERLTRGLRTAANALNEGDVGKAMMAALHLRLHDVSADGVQRLRRVDDFLAKYDPNEPRDWRGRWTTGGGDAPPSASAPPRSSASASASPPSSSTPLLGESLASEGDWGGPSHPTGGHLFLTQGGGGAGGGDAESDDFDGTNEPQTRDGTPIPEYPEFPSARVPVGWDQDDGTRKPTLPSGREWPQATAVVILRSLQNLKNVPGGPRVVLYVPMDGKGPVLMGSTDKEEFPEPPGYEKVYLEGIPQETRRGNEPTNHGLDGAERALELASTNRFDRIYFNRSMATSTNREIVSYLRPDVFARVRPGLDLGFKWVPQESLSPRQTLENRQSQMPDHPALAPVGGGFYKFLKTLFERRLAKLLQILGRR
jgi:hypothetical protein